MARKTYWHLADLKRKPTDYDIASSRLFYYLERGFEVETPLSEWYARHQAGSPLRCADWDGFSDPRETTYAKYVEIQKRKEIFVDGLFASIDATGYDRRLDRSWLALLERVLGPLRYPVHALQMVSAYAGSMAPGGRITIALALQAADEMRFVQRLAYRHRQIQVAHPGFGENSKQLWEKDPLWQPLRKVVERLLVAYDWGESFTALNLVLKPAFDELFLVRFGRLASERGDDTLAKILASLFEDAAWHREWSRALEVFARISSDNTLAIDGWIDRWTPPVAAAIDAFTSLVPR